MNYKDKDPNNLGEFGDMLPADVLKVLNELLEQLHRKDKNYQGSTVFIYAPGSQYVDKQFCSRWDRYLGMTAVMTQVPVPSTAI